MTVTQLAKLANREGWRKFEDGTIVCPLCHQGFIQEGRFNESDFMELTFRDAAVRHKFITCETNRHVTKLVQSVHLEG